MKHIEVSAGLALTAALLAGCSNEQPVDQFNQPNVESVVPAPELTLEPTPETTVETAPESTDGNRKGGGVSFQYDPNPETNFSLARCNVNDSGWASHIDGDPLDVEDKPFTVGFPQRRDAEGNPLDVVGMAVRGLGGFAYELALSDGSEAEVNLLEEDFAAVLDGGDGLKVIASAYMDDQGKVEFGIDCRRDFGSTTGNEVPLQIPLQEEPLQV